MNKNELQERIKVFVIRVLQLVKQLSNDVISNVISRQIVRCSTSIGANYRAACRAKSKADFIYKLKIVEEETDETCYFLMLLREQYQSKTETIKPLEKECDELLRIFVASIKTARLSKDS